MRAKITTNPALIFIRTKSLIINVKIVNTIVTAKAIIVSLILVSLVNSESSMVAFRA